MSQDMECRGRNAGKFNRLLISMRQEAFNGGNPTMICPTDKSIEQARSRVTDKSLISDTPEMYKLCFITLDNLRHWQFDQKAKGELK